MRRALQAFGLACFLGLTGVAFALPAVLHLTQEVLVLHSAAVQLPRHTLSPAFEIYNHGPNSIWCAMVNQADAVSGKSRQITAEATWAVDASPNVAVWCIADSADQVTGAATILTETR